jgi:poly-gamma-glutamate capsule biosynthesis protein CapA/YwtB (metallophosphatase superfamily)
MNRLVLLAVGDVGPSSADRSEELFSLCKDTLQAADLRFCHLDTPYSERGSPSASRGMPRRGHPSALDALKHGGFEIVDFASNHGLDWGVDAFTDTLDRLQDSGHHVIGAGRNLAEARSPVVIEQGDARVGFLAYCSIVMGRLSGYIADVHKPGVTPLRVYTHYEPAVEMFDYTPGMPARTVTLAYPEDLSRMRSEIEALREQVDVLIVSQHAGVPLLRAHVPMYQHEIGHAAIDAGADLVLQHHAHVLRGVEIYDGKVIFLGLGDFGYEVGLTTRGTVVQHESREADQLASLYSSVANQVGRAGDFFGPDERHYSMIAKITVEDGAISRVSYLPTLLNDRMQARVVGSTDPEGQLVSEYVTSITREVGLETQFDWDGDEVVVWQP